MKCTTCNKKLSKSERYGTNNKPYCLHCYIDASYESDNSSIDMRSFDKDVWRDTGKIQKR